MVQLLTVRSLACHACPVCETPPTWKRNPVDGDNLLTERKPNHAREKFSAGVLISRLYICTKTLYQTSKCCSLVCASNSFNWACSRRSMSRTGVTLTEVALGHWTTLGKWQTSNVHHFPQRNELLLCAQLCCEALQAFSKDWWELHQSAQSSADHKYIVSIDLDKESLF